MIIPLNSKVTKDQIKQLQEIYPGYIKVVIDIKRKILAAGCEYHIDCEEVLLRLGSEQQNLFGGGYNVKQKIVDYNAMSNFKPTFGHVTYEIADEKVRDLLKALVKKFLGPVNEG